MPKHDQVERNFFYFLKWRHADWLAYAHWDFLLKFFSLHYYTTLEGVLGVKRSGQAQQALICLFGLLFFSQNGMTFKKPTKIIKIQ